MSDKQKTIKSAVSIKGIGLHTGEEVTLTFNPAPVNHGFKFQRIDLENQPIIDASVKNVTDLSRGTTLEQNGGKVSTVEHSLAALTGLEVDNVLIEINGGEVPILDGSSKPFLEVLEQAGIEEQEADRDYYVVRKPIKYVDKERGVELMIVPDEGYSISAMIDYNSEVLGSQHAAMSSLSEFKSEISSCRTFVFLHELEMLLSHNLIKGGDLSNAIVIVDKKVEKDELDRLAKLFNKPSVEVKSEGILNNIDLHFANEPARHKLLDVVGDLALVGKKIKGKVIAKRPGHAANVELGKLILETMSKESKEVYFDLTAEPLYDTVQIMGLLPHRPPFLLVDKIMECENDRVIGVKNVTMNEPFFEGHFPKEPVMPGVLQIEAMAQTGGILVLSQVEDPENYITYFMKIDKVKFKRKVVPGDTLVFDLSLLSPVRRGICHMGGKAYVNGKVVMEAEMMAQITKMK
jgi:UDP-3-O-[3-hydroxymyristoyl] N-acetylglucosamine deacetylase/3-hydroxyacyl-[acyl-carrier-protein] dehydratase